VGVLETRGVGWQANVGGANFDVALANLFVAHVRKTQPSYDPLEGTHRGWARLLKEAEKVKEVLSANTEYWARVEGLTSDYDFVMKITRDMFEEVCCCLLIVDRCCFIFVLMLLCV
jgi:hypoxia up-regulated 1